MRKKQNPPGSPAPEETSATSTPAPVGVAHQVAKSDSSKPRANQRRSESDPVNDLSNVLEAYRASGSKKDREYFYENAWNLIEERARVQLRNHAWKGDVRQDAMEIASAVCARLCQQEEKNKGIFSPYRTPDHMRRYLNRTIYLAVSENRKKLGKKLSKHVERTRSLDDEESPVVVPETRKSDWLPIVVRVSKALDSARVKTKNVLPPGVGIDSTELVMDLVLGKTKKGDQLKTLAAIPGVPDRTQQHRAKRLRKNLRNELEI